MANTFRDTTAEKAIKKIVERIVEEVDGLEDLVRGFGKMGETDFGDIGMGAEEVKEWADKLANFAAVCEFGEADDSDIEKYVPIC